jgi:hypothetical protein
MTWHRISSSVSNTYLPNGFHHSVASFKHCQLLHFMLSSAHKFRSSPRASRRSAEKGSKSLVASEPRACMGCCTTPHVCTDHSRLLDWTSSSLQVACLLIASYKQEVLIDTTADIITSHYGLHLRLSQRKCFTTIFDMIDISDSLDLSVQHGQRIAVTGGACFGLRNHAEGTLSKHLQE